MDVGAANATEHQMVVDPVGSRCQKLFQDFLEEWLDGKCENILDKISILDSLYLAGRRSISKHSDC